MGKIEFTIRITRDDTLDPEPWTGVAFSGGEGAGWVVGAAAGASIHDVLIELAKQVDKASVPA